MTHLDYQRTGLVLGLFLAGFHLVWSILVLTGIGQWLLDLVLWAHMIHVQFVVGPFEIVAAAALIGITFVTGYLLGLMFAWFWNMLHRS